jgi:hypothetical protein
MANEACQGAAFPFLAPGIPIGASPQRSRSRRLCHSPLCEAPWGSSGRAPWGGSGWLGFGRSATSAVVLLIALSSRSLGGEDPPAPDTSTTARFASAAELPALAELPDPFRRADGTRVATEAEWRAHRDWLRRVILHYEYGHAPPAPGNVRAEITGTREIEGGAKVVEKTLVFGPGGALRMRIELTIPTGSGPFPAIVKEESALPPQPLAAEIAARGYILCRYVRTDLDPDKNDVVGPAQAAYPEQDWATIAVWAWGASRALDHLLELPEVDRERIAVTGHSRGGKTALLAGALDERFGLVAPNGSGAGGAGSYRVLGERPETLAAITDAKRFSYWFHQRLGEFADRVDRLPFDQHFVLALVAPRPVLATEAAGDLWANPRGTQEMILATREVYRFLGAEDRVGLHVRPGEHAQSSEDWRALLDFADLSFRGKAPPEGRRFDQLPNPDAPRTFQWKSPDPPRAEAPTPPGSPVEE